MDTNQFKNPYPAVTVVYIWPQWVLWPVAYAILRSVSYKAGGAITISWYRLFNNPLPSVPLIWL
jgi:hypothetical protein